MKNINNIHRKKITRTIFLVTDLLEMFSQTNQNKIRKLFKDLQEENNQGMFGIKSK